MSDWIKFIPNTLSCMRLLLALAFPFCPESIWALIIIGSGGTDFLDGWLARKWQVQSWQGGLLDAFADKLFSLIVLITFVSVGKLSGWWIPGLLARDICVACMAAYAAAIRSWASFKKMQVRLSGKITTALQFSLLLVVLVVPAQTGVVVIVAVVMSLIASCDYLILFAEELRQRGAGGRRR